MRRSEDTYRQGYQDNGSYRSTLDSPNSYADDTDAAKFAGFLSRTPSEDRRLLRALTVSPDTGDVQPTISIKPTKPAKTATKSLRETPTSQDEGISPGLETYGDASYVQRQRGNKNKTVRILTPNDNNTQDEWQAGKSVKEANSHMLRYEIACDVTFLVGDTKEEIRAHKYMLMSRSPVLFKSLIKHLGNMDVRINVPDIKPSTFRDMLTYIYTDGFDIHTDNVTSVLYAAKKFSLRGLSDMCFRFLDSEIETETVCKIMEQAHLYDEFTLYEKCMKYILMNSSEVLKSQSFVELCVDCVETIFKSDDLLASEEHVFEAAVTWAKMECRRQKRQIRDENLREALGKLLYLIRFPIMDVTYFTHKVSLGDILSNDETLSIFQYYHGEEQQLPSRFIRTERNRLGRKFSDNREPIIMSHRKLPNMSRVSRFRAADGQWKQHGPPDAISFSCSHPIVLYGIMIYGTARGSDTYTVKLVVYDDMRDEVTRSESTIHTNSTRSTYDVHLARPIRVPARRVFTVLISMKGGSTVKGTDGDAVHIVDGVTFEFSNSNKSSNGTDISVGQIPGLLFNKTD